MEWLTTIVINKRIAKHWGTRAAAVFGWIFAQCQAQVPREQCVRTECGRVYRKTVRVRVSCTQLGRLLHLSRHTVEEILHKFEAEGIIDVWLPRGEDRTRAYSIATKGFTLLHRWAGQWHTNDEGLSCWGLDTRVASVVGVNAAIVFHYLWLWTTAYRWGEHYTKGGRAWLPYTAAELSRWLPFLSDDVVEEALHTLQAARLLARMRQGKLTKWAINDAGYVAMGEVPPVRYADAAYMGEASVQQAHTARQEGFPAADGTVHTGVAAVAGSASWIAAVAAGAHEAGGAAATGGIVATSYSAAARAGGVPDTPAEEDAAIWAQAKAAQRAVRNRHRRLRRKGLTEWSPLSL